ncbi:MAG: PilT/PilU family type 4a pilus ATPase [Capsulimonas sp.]|uniref:type IV pilus twitching motility protein PilT n=1 Tax=Capsulimonas sp. TaxID=2494211 RepID=UPI0032673CC2
MELADLLSEFVGRQASDLHLAAGQPPTLRTWGALAPIFVGGGDVPPTLASEDVDRLFAEYLSDDELTAFRGGRDVNKSIEWEGNLFRCCFFQDRAGSAAELRLIPTKIPTLTELFGDGAGLFRDLTAQKRGLILTVGPTGSGKSTTVAAMIDEINRERCERIITIEDTVEFVHRSKMSMVSQREVGSSVESVEQGALSVLRADPDVVLIGELRTPEAVRITLALAETGHLVFATMHAVSVSEAVQRLIESFPDAQDTMRRMLARSVTAVISQRLLPRANGRGRVPVDEILLSNNRVRTLISDGATDLTLAMEAGRDQGMRTMDDAILEAYSRGDISYDTAWGRIDDRERLGLKPAEV